MVREARLRRLLFGIAALAAVLISGPMLPIELVPWFSAELLLYLEVVSAVWLTSRISSARAVWAHATRQLARIRLYLADDLPRRHPSLMSWMQGALLFQ